jgi:hypothetical protein
MTDAPELHVLPPERDGLWTVGIDGLGPPLSSHPTADRAQSAARRLAEAQGADRLYLHDCYGRVRTIRLGAGRS